MIKSKIISKSISAFESACGVLLALFVVPPSAYAQTQIPTQAAEDEIIVRGLYNKATST